MIFNLWISDLCYMEISSFYRFIGDIGAIICFEASIFIAGQIISIIMPSVLFSQREVR